MLLTALGAERNARIYSGKRQGRKKSGEFSPLFPENVKCRKYVRWPGELSPFPPLQTRAAAIRKEEEEEEEEVQYPSPTRGGIGRSRPPTWEMPYIKYPLEGR